MKLDREMVLSDEREVNVQFEYRPGSPGSYWDPPEGAEIEILKVTLHDGTEVKLDDSEYERLENMIHEDPPEDDYYDDYEYDSRRDEG